MKIKLLFFCVLTATSIFLSSCAAGSAASVASGYSLKADTANSLTPESEQKMITRIVDQVIFKLAEEKS